ncbi:hypothetical protein BN137_4210 [Cronobacter condimenti 1330]|uniref:Uncharacterized protein n=1 Tax=Cronobacter condimenti 1330 TaxID=1073999 RepID=K8AG86_9ENTR|nr:hypothetical protein BN137_4210 [Cronobacter condimenti 1330]
MRCHTRVYFGGYCMPVNVHINTRISNKTCLFANLLPFFAFCILT